MDISVENILFKHIGGHGYLFGFGRDYKCNIGVKPNYGQHRF